MKQNQIKAYHEDELAKTKVTAKQVKIKYKLLMAKVVFEVQGVC
jgi:hypothetical protein